ncbi:hypothetical protein IFO68_10760 [Photobacterium sp. CAU 1568]|uniref:Uncharacterized protein n=1 Tax=Photobacterium arenosum TaxID=2774143 RepID=A0ABR9BLU7_9GAMM|nr:hypothetical protein [Photobacterium arenosum]MBD8513154.1 hypothetical protein [Photobacterium arenosum]
MRITAVTQDQLIVIDGVPAFLGHIGGYAMRQGEWAVDFNTLTGLGHIEYTDNRPNQIIDSTVFNAAYAWLIDEHKRYVTAMAEQHAAEEAARNEQQQDLIDTESDGDGVSSNDDV